MNRISALERGEDVPSEVIYKIRTRNGGYKWSLFQTRYTRSEDNHLLSHIVASDITPLREAELKAQTYLNVAPALFVALSPEGNITMINKFGMDLLECDSRIIGVNWFDTFISEIDKCDIQNVFKDLVEGKRLFSVCENEVFTLKGNKRILSWRNSVLKDINGKVTTIIAAGNDITEQRMAENELEKHWADEEERLEYTLKDLSILRQSV
jgi:PAS domain S-box-containing protein